MFEGAAVRKVLFLLGQMSDEDVEWLIDNGNRRSVPAGAELIAEGGQIQNLYILLQGALEVSGTQMGDTPIRLESGEVVGEVSLLDSRPPTADVTARTDCIVLEFTHEELREKLAADESFAARFYHALAVFLAYRLRNTYQRMGFGKDQNLDDQEFEDELSPEVLDSLHLAAKRFDRVLNRLLTGSGM